MKTSDGISGVAALSGEEADSEFRLGWPVVLACFCMAVFSWGFGFYGQAVYLAELQATRGWSASLVASATTIYYLFGAFCLTAVHGAIERFGARLVLAAGTVVLGVGAIAISRAVAPWQLYAGSLVMGVGWACTSSTAIATTLALWFDRRRGLAISLALNGASAGGFTVAPALVFLSRRHGLETAVAALAAAMLLVLVPLILMVTRSQPGAAANLSSRRDAPPQPGGSSAVLRDPRFWTVAAPFALAVAAQVGFIVHQVSFLLPRLGVDGTGLAVACTSGAAVLGRLALGLVIDRLDQRRVSAATFASQAAALLLMMALPDVSGILYLGSIAFGLSVGNVITLPALIVQREFSAAAFGMVIGLSTAVGQFAYAFAPAALGIIHDVVGGYGPALGLCAALDGLAALIVLRGRRPGRP
jgi:predicted MFS family arabinose efflux permease